MCCLPGDDLCVGARVYIAQESFDNVEMWLGEIEKHSQDNSVKLIVGNKCDLERRPVASITAEVR